MSKTTEALKQPHLTTLFSNGRVSVAVPNPLRKQGIAPIIDTWGETGKPVTKQLVTREHRRRFAQAKRDLAAIQKHYASKEDRG